MYIEHVSDTHGSIFSFSRKNSILIHSGDMLPNSEAILNGDIEEEIKFQKAWVINNIHSFPKQFLFTLGNHDFIDGFELENIFKFYGVNGICLHDTIVNLAGINFYGFPFITHISGKWNYECKPSDMAIHADNLIDKIDRINAIVAHGPFDGVLDYTIYHEKTGNSVLSNKLMYSDCMGNTLKYYFHGHIHESYGVSFKHGVLFSNAATTKNIIEF